MTGKSQAPDTGPPPLPARKGHGIAGLLLLSLLLSLLLPLLLPLPTSAQTAPRIGIRAGNHPGFGRLVFDVPPGTHYRLSRDGDRVVVRFEPADRIGAPPALPRNVRAVTPGAGEAGVLVVPNATMHDMRLGNHVVLDVFDPATQAHPGPDRPVPAAKTRPGAGPTRAGAAPATTHSASATRPETSPAREKPGSQAIAKPKTQASAPTKASAPAPAAAERSRTAPAPTSAEPRVPGAPKLPPGKSESAGAQPAAPAATSPKAPAPPPPEPAPPQPERAPANAAATAAVAEPAGSAPDSRTAQASGTAPASERGMPAQGGGSPGMPLASQFVPPPRAAEDALSPLGSFGLAVRLVPPPAGRQGAAFAVPFPDKVGAAAFRREDVDYVVFDDRRPLDLSALRHDRLLWTARVQLLPSATLIRLRLPPGMTLRLSPAPQGWRVAALAAAPPPEPIVQHVEGDRLLLRATAPNQVVSFADPETGTTLLVGTQRRAGQAVVVRRTGPEFSLLPSWQGVLVEALSDRLTLRRVENGFALGAEPGGLTISPINDDARADAVALTRRFHFPALPTDILRQRIATRQEQAAAAPPLARGPLRQALARDMIAIGMAPEAEALLHVAMQEDPSEAASPDAAGLTAIAALLAHRPAEAQSILDPKLSGTDEVAFWRGVLLAMLDNRSPQAAASFAATAALALDYPAAMRKKLLPLVVETMLRGGQAEAAQALLARCGKEPGLAMARAMSDAAVGKVDAALTAYDALANSADRRISARAAVRALELRLKLARISVHRAADGLDRLLYAWRGDRRDLALRERLAQLRQQDGNWRSALAVLRGAKHDFPRQRLEILARMQETFAALLRNGAMDRLSPLALVTLVDENTDLLPTSADGEALQAHLADRLLALDLPDRAGPVLEKLMRTAPTATARAGFGTRLAAMRLHEGDAAGALQALLASAASKLPDELGERRRLLFAAATAHRGDFRAALASLDGLHSAAAAAERADILEQSQDWWGADQAMTEYVDRTVPVSGTLNDPQRQALLRLATAAARAGDAATLAGLNARESVRIGSGPLADMFHLLTAPPVRGTADLTRARREVGLAQALPASLQAVEPPTALH